MRLDAHARAANIHATGQLPVGAGNAQHRVLPEGTHVPDVGDDEQPGGHPVDSCGTGGARRLSGGVPSHPLPRPRRRPEPDRRRALELHASCRDGCTEAVMLAHGFSIHMMVELVRAGLATARAERMLAGGRAMEVIRVRITEKGPRRLRG
jgi:hypothetical protein